ncbi:MAG: DUF3127 domain-containing protein [Flavobacteriaceae bacterium]|nr:DUF3127 domain-containing protein [Flavobacteriaceae bacterium]
MDITGKLKLINETKEYGSNGFKKREVVITTEEQYPQDLLIEFIQDKCDLLNSFQVGQSVKVDINLRGRECESPQGEIKYFNSVQGWRIEKLFSENDDSAIPPVPPAEAFEPADEINKEEPDDLPF